MFISQDIFILFIIVAIFTPIISVITLFMTSGFEKEFRLITAKKEQKHLEEKYRKNEYILLNTQIQPHFLFNTLNLILGYAQIEENDKLIRTLEKFSMYLKYHYQVQDSLIPLYKEYTHTKNYLAIQQARFDSHLNISYTFDDHIKHALVPPFILQTLVENSFKHGLENKLGQKQLAITIKQKQLNILMEVFDNGDVASHQQNKTMGKTKYGLRNIEERLTYLFDGDFNLQINFLKEGTKVSIIFPLIFEKSSDNDASFNRR